MTDPDAENLPPSPEENDETMCSTFSAVPTPKRNNTNDETTSLLVDFTEQFNSISQCRTSPAKRNTLAFSPSRTQSDLASYAHAQRNPATPSPKKRMSNLLDFDIPPAPTPRSMPSITPRELESMRSGFLCQISNLKAELSGKEAETQALKRAVADAEKRTGENMERLREEQQEREQLMAEKELLEKRSHEIEQVLRNVKEEIVLGERERDDLEGRLEESEKRREAAEMMHQEVESRIAAMRAGKTPLSPSPENGERKTDVDKKSDADVNRDVEQAVEKVARELHTLYKSKHETKVAALKKSYEGRWQRKVKDLEDKLEQVTKDFDELKTARDATMSGVVAPSSSSRDMPDFQEELKAQAAKDAATAKELEAKLLGLTEEVKCINRDNAALREELDKERVEKGELVAAVEEMFELQLQNQTQLAAASTPIPTSPTPKSPTRRTSFSPVAWAPPQSTPSAPQEGFRTSGIGRPSGLRIPSVSAAAGESRIAKVGISAQGHGHGVGLGHSRLESFSSGSAGSGFGSGSGLVASGHARTGSAAAQGSRSRTGSSGLGVKSGIMSSIEKMGKGRGSE